MKTKFLILVLFTSLIAHCQTRAETIDWLNIKFKEHTSAFMGQFNIKVVNDPNYGEILQVSAKVENAQMSKWYRNYSFLPKNIESVTTTTAFRTDGKLGILITAKGSDIYYNKEFVEQIEIDCIASADEEIIRIQKGLIHLLNLMGNPLKLPKEFFKD